MKKDQRLIGLSLRKQHSFAWWWYSSCQRKVIIVNSTSKSNMENSQSKKNHPRLFKDISFFSKFIQIDDLFEIDFNDMESIIHYKDNGNIRVDLKNHIKKICFLLYLNDPILAGYERSAYFIEIIKWFFCFEYGHIAEQILIDLLKNTKAKMLFKQDWMEYQSKKSIDNTCFNLNKPIKFPGIAPIVIFYYKANLARIIRLLMLNYNSSTWLAMSHTQKYAFTKAIIHLTLSNGIYGFINNLFDPLEKQESILDLSLLIKEIQKKTQTKILGDKKEA